MQSVAPERSGWRDLELSQRHRRWGYDVPAVDIDYFLAYDNGRVVALIEYKHQRAKPQDFAATNYQAFVDVANRAGLPAFVVRYYPPDFWMRVTPMNRHAAAFIPFDYQDMTEHDFVALYYRMRNRTTPHEVAAGLIRALPDSRPENLDLWSNRKVRAHMWEGKLDGYPGSPAPRKG
jgi:hypothetical protein